MIAPNWAEYAVLYPHGISYHATIDEAALATRASGRSDFCVMRTSDGRQVWPLLNPRAPRGVS